MKKFVFSLALGLCACALCFSSALAAETLRVGGGSTPMENIFKRIKEPFQEKTGITIELVENGAVDAYMGLMNGQLDVATAGIGSLNQWQDRVAKAGNEAAPREKLVWHIVGTTVIAVYANKNVTVDALDKDQVKGIFTGKITNWKEVGGQDAPIVVVLGTKVPVMTGDFRSQALGGADLLQTAEFAGTANEMKEKVIATPNSISIGTSIQLQDDRLKPIKAPESQHYISMLWKFDAPKREAAQTLYQWLGTAEAKQYTLSGLHDGGYGHEHK